MFSRRAQRQWSFGLSILLYLALTSSILALPFNRTVTPAGDGDGVDLDVGQHVLVTSQNWGLGITLIIVGLMEVFYGFKLIRITLFVTGFLSWAVLAMMIMVAIRWDLVYTTFMPQYYYLWVWLASGLTGALLSFRFWDLGVTFTGAFGGFAVAMGIIAAANLAFSNAGRYVILCVLILGGAAVATFYERLFIILATSFGGAYMFMFGVDQFAQVGYQEMIVIFDFTGQTLVYLPNKYVYIMLGSSLVLAGFGIGWELWHHETPFLVHRKEVFRIYGRPFGKRPSKLIGQRIHHHMRTKGWYAYLRSGACLQRWTIEDVLYDDDHCATQTGQAPSAPAPYPSTEPTPQAGEYPPCPITTPPSDHDPPEKGGKTTESDASEVPLKTAPLSDDSQDHKDGSAATSSPHNSNSSNDSGSGTHEAETVAETSHPAGSSTSITQSSSTNATEQVTTATTATTTEAAEHAQSSTGIEGHTILGVHLPFVPNPSTPSGHPWSVDHPLFSPHLGTRTMEFVDMVTEHMLPGNTIPREYMAHRSTVAAASRATVSPHPPLSSPQTLHMFEFSENTVASTSHESQGSESSLKEEEEKEED